MPTTICIYCLRCVVRGEQGKKTKNETFPLIFPLAHSVYVEVNRTDSSSLHLMTLNICVERALDYIYFVYAQNIIKFIIILLSKMSKQEQHFIFGASF